MQLRREILLPRIVRFRTPERLGNANSKLGAREITIGQQSVNIRGIGLIDNGGANVITNGYKVDDIENIVMTRLDGIPVQVKDVAMVVVGCVPRLGIAGRDHDDGVTAAIVVMIKTQHTNEILPRVQAEVDKINGCQHEAGDPGETKGIHP